MKAPLWKLIAFNSTSHVFCEVEPKRFSGPLHAGAVLVGMRFGGLGGAKYKRSEQIAGLTADRVLLESASSSAKESDRSIKQLDYWIYRKITLPSEVYHVLDKFYSVPSQEGIPLKCVRLTSLNSYTVLDTTSAVKQDLPESTFSIAPNFKRVQTQDQVFLDLKKAGVIQEMLEGLGK